jgi:hypothetical protein
MVLETIILAFSLSSVASYETTGKGLTDHTVSTVRGEDCKIARSFQGQEICEPKSSVSVEAYKDKEVDTNKVVVKSNTVDDYEKILAQRKGAR